jgi:hypothetical protein
MATSIESLRKARIVSARRRDVGAAGPEHRSGKRQRKVQGRDRRELARYQASVPGLYLG